MTVKLSFIPGVKAVGFSPIGCGTNGTTLLAILTVDHHLQIYSKKNDGTSIRWMEANDISNALVTMVKENKGFYPTLQAPLEDNPVKKAERIKYASCIDNFQWTSIFIDENTEDRCVYLVTSTKMNFLIIWKLCVPCEKTSTAEAIAFIKAFDEGSISSIVVHPTVKERVEICAGNVNGKIVSITIDQQGNEQSRHNLWNDDDELTVSCMDWQHLPNESGTWGKCLGVFVIRYSVGGHYVCISDCSILIVAKGFLVMSVKLSATREPSCFVLKHVHALSVCSLVAVESLQWIVADRGGSMGHIRFVLNSLILALH